MKKETVLKALNDIDDGFIEEAAPKGYLPKEKPGFSWLNMRMLAGALAVVLMAVLLPNILRPADSGQPGNIQLVNPASGYPNLAEAEKVTGFPLDCPNIIQDWKASEINVIANVITEVSYVDKSGQTVLYVRKAKGSDDISGDYNEYSFEKELETDGKTVTVKGSDNLCYLLIWTDQGYSYAVSAETGISLEEAAEIAADIH